MKFRDEEIEKLDLSNADDVLQLLIAYLCAEKYYKELSEKDKDRDRALLQSLLENARERDLNYEQFNELLLLLKQDRVSGAFLQFIFEKDNILLQDLKISLDDLKRGVIRFRGFAMLCLGNFRFAYKRLTQKNSPELGRLLNAYGKEAKGILERFRARPQKMLEIEPIKRDATWYIGYISQKKFEKEYEFLKKLISSGKIGNGNMLSSARKKYHEMEKAIVKVNEKALNNTDIYLTWDYMDVYIATSMRNKWEFQEAHDLVSGIFGNSKIKDLNLRYFDPTQSKV